MRFFYFNSFSAAKRTGSQGKEASGCPKRAKRRQIKKQTGTKERDRNALLCRFQLWIGNVRSLYITTNRRTL